MIERIATSSVGELLVEHYASLPVWVGGDDDAPNWKRPLPWIGLYLVLPAAGTTALGWAHLSTESSTGLLAGVGVLGGLLFQVLAWVAGRAGAIADGMNGRPATGDEIDLLRRLDITRANIAYASLISIVLVVELGIGAILKKQPTWMSLGGSFLLLHLGFVLVLVLLRINSIGKSDRIAALTAHASARTHTRHVA